MAVNNETLQRVLDTIKTLASLPGVNVTRADIGDGYENCVEAIVTFNVGDPAPQELPLCKPAKQELDEEAKKLAGFTGGNP